MTNQGTGISSGAPRGSFIFKPIILTKAGEWLNQELGMILSRLDQIETIKQNVSADPSGCVLRIGDAGGATAEILAPALQILRRRYPKIKTTFYQNNSSGFFEDILEARIDCAFPMLASNDPDLVSHQVLTHRIGVVLPVEHRLSQYRTVAFPQPATARSFAHCWSPAPKSS
jgi:DNA-binding transcriptional LysR family regulator